MMNLCGFGGLRKSCETAADRYWHLLFFPSSGKFTITTVPDAIPKIAFHLLGLRFGQSNPATQRLAPRKPQRGVQVNNIQMDIC
jgi:hypothetical protein